MSSSIILLDNSSQSHYSKLDNLTSVNAEMTTATSEDEPSPSSPEDASSNPSTSPSSPSDEEKKVIPLVRTRRASLNKPQTNIASVPTTQTPAVVPVPAQTPSESVARESRPSISSGPDEKLNRVTIKNPKRRASVTSQSSIQEQPATLLVKRSKNNHGSKPLSGSKIDFSSLDFNTLKKYKRVYKLRTKSNVTKSELVMAIQEHHVQQNVNESDVISSFMNVVKRQAKLNASSTTPSSSLAATSSNISSSTPYLVDSFQTTNRGGGSGDYAKQQGKS